jgi:hypothetical protein
MRRAAARVSLFMLRTLLRRGMRDSTGGLEREICPFVSLQKEEVGKVCFYI